MNEILNTAGEIRRFLANTMVEVKNGQLDLNKGMVVAMLSKELTGNMLAEVNVMKTSLMLQNAGINTNKIQHMGKLLIGDDSVPTLDGKA